MAQADGNDDVKIVATSGTTTIGQIDRLGWNQIDGNNGDQVLPPQTREVARMLFEFGLSPDTYQQKKEMLDTMSNDDYENVREQLYEELICLVDGKKSIKSDKKTQKSTTYESSLYPKGAQLLKITRNKEKLYELITKVHNFFGGDIEKTISSLKGRQITVTREFMERFNRATQVTKQVAGFKSMINRDDPERSSGLTSKKAFCYRLATMIRLILETIIKFNREEQQGGLSEKTNDLGYALCAASTRIWQQLHTIYGEKFEQRKIVQDYKSVVEQLKKKCAFNFQELALNFPHHQLQTPFDTICPAGGIKPYPEQIELMNKLRDVVIEIGGLIKLAIGVGCGKTTMVAGILAWAHQQSMIAKSLRGGKPIIVIFCCSNVDVRIHAARVAIAASAGQSGCGTALASYGKDEGTERKFVVQWGLEGEVTIQMQYNCREQKQRHDKSRTPTRGDPNNIRIIFADVASTVALLKEQQVKKEKIYAVFGDELTIGADRDTKEVSEITQMIPEIMRSATGPIIMSSATLPINDMASLEKVYLANKPKAQIVEIVSMKAHIGMEVKSVGEHPKSFTLETSCQTVAELQHVIKNAQREPFLARMCPAKMYFRLLQNTKQSLNKRKIILSDEFNLSTFDNDSSLWEYNAIRDKYIALLQFVVDLQDDEIVKEITQPYKFEETNVESDSSSEEDDDSDDDIVFEKAQKQPVKKVTHEVDPEDSAKIFGLHACHFVGPTMISTEEPINWAMRGYNAMTAQYKKYTKKDISIALLKRLYDKEEKAYRAEMDRIDRMTFQTDSEKPTSKKTSVSDASEGKVAMEKSRMRSSILKPVFKFPAELQINTATHYKMFHLGQHPASFSPRPPIDVNSIDIDALMQTGISEDLIMLLFCGVGVYVHGKDLPSIYMYQVMKLAEQGSLQFVVTNDSLNYGVNYPFVNVVISDTMIGMSIGAWMQAAGRAGRFGLTHVATLYLDKLGLERINAFKRGLPDTIQRRDMSQAHRSLEAVNFDRAVDMMMERDRLAIKTTKKVEQSQSVKLVVNSVVPKVTTIPKEVFRPQVVQKSRERIDIENKIQKNLYLNPRQKELAQEWGLI